MFPTMGRNALVSCVRSDTSSHPITPNRRGGRQVARPRPSAPGPSVYIRTVNAACPVWGDSQHAGPKCVGSA